MRHTNGGIRKICDCPRRAWAKCAHPWHLNFKPKGGKAYRFSLDAHLNKHVDSKTDAEAEAALIKAAIKAGTFGQAVPTSDMTLRQLADTYLERSVAVEHPDTAPAYALTLRTICGTVLPRPTGGSAPFGDWRLADVRTDTVERYREVRRGLGTGLTGINRHLGSLRALFNWGIRAEYVEKTPFQRGTQVVVKLSKEHSRSRRLQDDEAKKLLAACGPHLRAIVECALATGMRRGEILSLQWKQIESATVEEQTVVWAPRAAIVLPWAKTKTRRDRRIPISSRLRAMLTLRRFDPAGQPLPPTAYVFGSEIGTRVLGFGRAWRAAVLRAHGLTPTYTATANLSPTSYGALRTIDLHFHDLRREAGSRWLEGGVPLHTIRDWLGHVNISQTSTYLSGTAQTQHDAMAQFEQRTTLQQIATEAGSGGQNRPQTTEEESETPNETAVDRNPTVM